ELALAQLAARDLADLLDADVDARSEVLLARPDVDAHEARVAVLRREAVDGVRHPTLLADLLEEPRRRGAAEHRVEKRCGETPPVGTRDPGCADAQVVLLGVLALEAEPRPWCLPDRTAQSRRPACRSLALALEAVQQREEPVVADVAGRGHDDVRTVVHRPVIRGDCASADRRDDLRRS